MKEINNSCIGNHTIVQLLTQDYWHPLTETILILSAFFPPLQLGAIRVKSQKSITDGTMGNDSSASSKPLTTYLGND
jgi:hypothetical protein